MCFELFDGKSPQRKARRGVKTLKMDKLVLIYRYSYIHLVFDP